MIKSKQKLKKILKNLKKKYSKYIKNQILMNNSIPNNNK